MIKQRGKVKGCETENELRPGYVLLLRGMTLIRHVGPFAIGLVFIAPASTIKEPARQKFMAVMVVGAGAAYLSAFGLGYWEFAFTTAVTYCAYRGWLLHTAWDIVHHLSGSPLLPFSNTSSFGCAICDPVIALWCFAGAPSFADRSIRRGRRAATAGQKSTRCLLGTFRISRNLGLELCTESEQRVYLILEDGKPFARSQRQNPADQRKIHAVFTALWHHEFSIIPVGNAVFSETRP
jgi:hypothetical protein